MTILFLTMSSFSQYPVYKRAVGMGGGLAQHGHRVYIVARDCPENRVRLPREAPQCEPLWVTSRSVVGEIVQKLRLVWQVKPDCIFSMSYAVRNLMGLSWLFPSRSKYILEICELYSAYQRFGWLREYFIALAADGVLCASRYLVEVMERRVRTLGVTTRLIYQPYACPSHLSVVQGLKKDAIVYMAYMSKGYGCFMVAEAFLKIHNLHPEIVLEMLGSGPDLAALKEWVGKSGCDSFIRVRGYVAEEDLPQFFSRARVFVAPMQNTKVDIARCPSKIFHYIPYEKPIVTCRLGNPYDVLGEDGYYYEPENVEDLARVFCRAIQEGDQFKYPSSFIKANNWNARACEFEKWMQTEFNQ